MATQFFGYDNVKSINQMKGKDGHIFRQWDVENANPNMLYKNEILIDLPEDMHSSVDFYNTKIADSPWYDKNDEKARRHQIGNDTVKASEVLLTFSRKNLPEAFDVREWSERSVEFLKATFREDNIAYAVLHMDERNPHIHAMVVPLDDKGKLSFNHFCRGKSDYWRLHEEYNKYVGCLGLEKPARIETRCGYKRIKEYYENTFSEISRKLPEPQQGETTGAYYERASEHFAKQIDHLVYDKLEYEALVTRADRLAKSNRILDEKILRAEKELQDSERELSRSREENRSIKKELDLERAKNDTLEGIFREQSVEKNRMEFMYLEAKKHVPELARKYEELKDELTDMTHNLYPERAPKDVDLDMER